MIHGLHQTGPGQVLTFSIELMVTPPDRSRTGSDLLYRADGDSCSTGHYKVSVLDVWSNLIQHKGDDVGFDCQEQDITLVHHFLVTGGEDSTHFLEEEGETERLVVRIAPMFDIKI